jgi:hypothetical protein
MIGPCNCDFLPAGPSVVIIRVAAAIVNGRRSEVDTPYGSGFFSAPTANMLLFDIDFAEDDLRVLSAYARAQDLAEAARKSQPQAETSITISTPPSEEGEEFGDSFDEGDASLQDAQAAPRRSHTWIARLRAVAGIADERLAPIHGRLIAHGLLQFQLQGREEGVVYRVTSAGRQRLNPAAAEAA